MDTTSNKRDHQRATLIGSGGLIGRYILEYLLSDPEYEKVRILVRKDVSLQHPKLEIVKLDFSDLEAFRKGVEGSDVLFCSVGTTSKKVKGDKERYRKVDFDIPFNAAGFGASSGCRHFLLVSSIGANPRSRIFYSRLKGEVEEAVKKTDIPCISIFRPSLLLGKRDEFRFGELIAQKLIPYIDFTFPSNYRSIKATDVAKAMVSISHKNEMGVRVVYYRGMRGAAGD